MLAHTQPLVRLVRAEWGASEPGFALSLALCMPPPAPHPEPRVGEKRVEQTYPPVPNSPSVQMSGLNLCSLFCPLSDCLLVPRSAFHL